MDAVRAASDAARALDTCARVHIKVDTGMTRLGVLPEEAVAFARAVRDLGHVEIDGVFTHFAMADTFASPREDAVDDPASTPDADAGADGHAADLSIRGRAYTQQQMVRFRETIEALERAGIHARYRHLANSPALLNLPAARFNLVRSGILIYGLAPSDETPCPPDFIPALSFKTRVASVKSVPAGTSVGYGCTFQTARTSRIAVLTVGYADGFRRQLSNRGVALVRGRRAPVVGRVCMDMTMVDVTGIDGVQPGDEVVLIGRQGAEAIGAEEVARMMETNSYETVATISARVERRYT